MIHFFFKDQRPLISVFQILLTFSCRFAQVYDFLLPPYIKVLKKLQIFQKISKKSLPYFLLGKPSS